VVLGGDTRASTPELVRWLAEGLGRGVAVTFLGTVPTPAVAQVTRALGASCGAAVSASHNPLPDNGIKLVDGEGFKWPPAWEADLEAALEETRVEGAEPVELEVDHESIEGYLRSLGAAVRGCRSADGDGLPLAGLTLAVDAGNGAASPYAERLFASLGARPVVINATPDGRNINAGCGSTHPEVVAELTLASGADLGLSFDGDADRVILADEKGEIRDGDAILYLWGRDLAERGALPGRRVVATSMSNLGLDAALAAAGISLVRCDVGDRVVVDTMRREGAVLGGEQSGHVVNLELGTTGDGLLTALVMATLLVRRERPFSELCRGLERFPQLIENVRVREKIPFEVLPAVVEARRRVEEELARSGRLVLRYSGTEPLARIMIEGRDRGRIEALAGELAAAISTEIGE
jgi:phosphoglucosamine mutase